MNCNKCGLGLLDGIRIGNQDWCNRCLDIEFRRLSGEVERLREEVATLSTPDYYWDDDDVDQAIIEQEIGEYSDLGDVIPVRPVHELPVRYAACLAVGVELYDTLEEAERAAESAKGGE